jgi:hypothetical protein
MLRLVAFIILIVAIPNGTYSDDLLSDDDQFYKAISVNENDVFKNWGVGAFSCAKYVEARELPDSPVGPYDATFRQWFMGFTTAFNIKDPDTRDLLGRTSVERGMKWIESFCRKHGEEQFFTGVWQFIKIAYPHRAKQAINLARK